MKSRIACLVFLLGLLSVKPAAAENRFIVRSTLGSQALSTICLLQGCSLVGAIDGTLNQVFLITAPDLINPTTLLNLLRVTPGILAVELDQVVPLLGGQNQVTTIPAGLSDTTSVNYFGATVWDGYANQPAALIVRVSESQNTFHVSGTGIVADIDTGVDPTHPALQAVLLPGYDFTRNQPNGSELTDFTQPAPSGNSPAPAQVNQSTAAVLDQSTAAVLDGNVKYAAFGHGTMVMGVIHLVAPHARLLPLKAFNADGSAYLSDILRAIYYAVQNNANVINMSFDLKTSSQELQDALNYANQLNVVCVASSGNDGQKTIVYPAAFSSDVMGVASTSDLDTRSPFSNYGNPVVWVAAPGEAIITTYPFGTYSSGWGTSFSAPFVSGTAALLLGLQSTHNQAAAASAIAHAQFVGPDMGSGRLDIYQALQSVQPVTGPADFSITAGPSEQSVTAGQSASYTISVSPSGGFNQTVNWVCDGVPAAATCSVSPTSTTFNGSAGSVVSISVGTTARSTASVFGGPDFFPANRIIRALFVIYIALAGAIWKLSTQPRPGYARKLLPITAILFMMCCASCGGGSSASSAGAPPIPPSSPQNQGTPAGVSTITITGSATGTTHSVKVQLTVN